MTLTPQDTSTSEGAKAISFNLTRPPNEPAATFYVSTTQTEGFLNNGDYSPLLNSVVSFSANQTTATVTVSVTDDDVVESAETFGLILQRNASDPVGAFVAKSTFTITDDDLAPSVGATAAELFAGRKWSVMADFSKAAYAVGADPAPDDLASLTDLLTEWTQLTSKDLNGLSGLSDLGIYEHLGASALVARCADSVVISFTGTNWIIDGVEDLATMMPQFILLLPLINALDNFIQKNHISTVYVTGHSLGGALAQIYMSMKNHQPGSSDTAYEAVTFAAPGFNALLPLELVSLVLPPARDGRVLHFEFDKDLVPDLLKKTGDTVYLNSGWAGLAHSINLYGPAVKQLDAATKDKSFNLTGNDSFNVLFGESHSHDVFMGSSDEAFTVYTLGAGIDELNDDGLLLKTYELMIGGSGDDTYTVNFAKTKVLEMSNEGTDTVKTDVDNYTLPTNVENLVLLNLPLDFTPPRQGSGNELDNEITGNGKDNALSGLGGADRIYGRDGTDRLTGGAGNDWLYGEDGIDWALYDGKRANFDIGSSGDTRTVADKTGAEGTDSLLSIERGQFTDVCMSFDEGGTTIAKLIGAIFGKGYLAPDLVGIGLSLFDDMSTSAGGASARADTSAEAAALDAVTSMQVDVGQVMQQIAQLALGTELYVNLAGSGSNRDFVNLIYRNVVGVAPGMDDLAHFQGLLDRADMTQAQLAVMAAETDLNKANIDLVGLAQQGLEYIPYLGG